MELDTNFALAVFSIAVVLPSTVVGTIAILKTLNFKGDQMVAIGAGLGVTALLGGVGAGLAGGIGYGFGLRYGFERLFPAYQTGGIQSAVDLTFSDIQRFMFGETPPDGSVIPSDGSPPLLEDVAPIGSSERQRLAQKVARERARLEQVNKAKSLAGRLGAPDIPNTEISRTTPIKQYSIKWTITWKQLDGSTAGPLYRGFNGSLTKLKERLAKLTAEMENPATHPTTKRKHSKDIFGMRQSFKEKYGFYP